MRSFVRLLCAIWIVCTPVQDAIGGPVPNALPTKQQEAPSGTAPAARSDGSDEVRVDKEPAVRAGPVLPSEDGPWSAFPDREALFRDLRKHLTQEGVGEFTTEARWPLEVACDTQIYVTVFQRGNQPVRWGSKDCDPTAALRRILARIKEAKRFKRHLAGDHAATRILLEYAISSQPMRSFAAVTDDGISRNRFEPGISGFRFSYQGKLFFYMPTEAFTRSHMSLDQVLPYLARRVGLRGPEAVKTFLANASDVELIHSRAFVSFGDRVLPLYRGHPAPLPSSERSILESVQRGVEWIVRHQKPNGQFLYYYDAQSDSTADYQHPRNPDYYNILRHSGGIITLLRAMELTQDSSYLAPIRRAISYLITHSVSYQADGEKRRYVFYNKKAKLGGTGLALVALMHYHRLTGDSSYLDYADELASHLLSQILSDGEFLGYFIHPKFNNGEPLVSVTPDQRRRLFSFYYPGEALLGLALYERHAPLDESRRSSIRAKSRMALDFLMFERPKRYADLFLSLPADSWLMQAIEEWWYHPEMRHPAYARFVYSDALQMIDHMYQPGDALYPDYVGHFYYVYGEHAIPDGSRAEGLMAAFMLARQRGDEALARSLLEKIWPVAVGLQQTYNSPEAMYAAKDPEKAIGAFRFKLTRQWVRVDSVQHTVCFYARLLMALAAGKRAPGD